MNTYTITYLRNSKGPIPVIDNKNIKSHVNQKGLLTDKLNLWMDPIICKRIECQHHLGLTMDQLGKSRRLLSAETRKANLVMRHLIHHILLL